MVTIYNGRAIKIAWTIFKGVSAVKENFDRANVVCFLIDHRRNKINVSCRQEQGTIYVDIPEESLLPGIYSIELLWAKNRDFTRPHNWEIAPWVLNHTFLDSRNIVRCLKEDLFAVTEYEEEESSMIPDEGTVVIKAKSSAATYGYDGLDAYEMSVVFGYTTLSRDEWLAQLNDPQTWFMNYLSELIRLNNLKAPGSRTFNVTKVAGNWTYNGEDTATEGLPYSIQVIADEHYTFDTEHLSLTMGGYPITNETEGVSISWSDINTTLDITIERVTGHIRIAPTAIAESGTISLQADMEHQPAVWKWVASPDSDTAISSIDGAYNTESVAYLKILDPTNFKLSDGGIYYEDAGDYSCEVDYESVGDNIYEVTFTKVTGDVTICVSVESVKVSITNNATGYTVTINGNPLAKGNSVEVTPGTPVTIVVSYPNDYHQTTSFKITQGSNVITPIFDTGANAYSKTINDYAVNGAVVLSGTAVEDAILWNIYDGANYGINDGDSIETYVNANKDTMLNGATTATGAGTSQGYASSKQNFYSFFVAYPTQQFPDIWLNQLDTDTSTFEQSEGKTVSVTWNEKPYNVWVMYNRFNDQYSNTIIKIKKQFEID